MRHRPKVQEKIWGKKVLNKHKYWKQLVRKKKHEARDKENKPKKKQQQIKLSQTLAQPRKRK